ncbi:hypothetical protein ACS0ZG_29240 [Burkholderia gladioli]|uniref:hypothetical protein n=2 Tax=Burkholderia gladioli TaxID=28095 RepID=UPI003F7AB4F3
MGDNLILHGLDLWEHRSTRKLDKYDQRNIAEALFYCAKFIQITDSMTPIRRIRALAKFKGAFGKPGAIRAMIFETFIFHALKGRGFSVECKDDDVGPDRYDFLVTDKGQELQVECKSFAYDKGLSVTSKEANDLASEVLNKNLDVHRNSEGEVCFATVELRRNIARSKTGKENLVESIVQSLSGDDSEEDERYRITIDRIDYGDDIENWKGVLDFPERGAGIELARLEMAANGKKSRFCLRVTTTTTDAFWREFENVCKFAAKQQLGTDRSSIIALHISNIDSLEAIVGDSRFHSKMRNVFHQPHITRLILVANIDICEQNEAPYFILYPIIKEFPNNDAKFPNTGTLITSLEWSGQVIDKL